MKGQWKKNLPSIIALLVVVFVAGPLLWRAGGLDRFARSALDDGLDLGLALGYLFAGIVIALGKTIPEEQRGPGTLLAGLVFLSLALLRFLGLFVLTPPTFVFFLPLALAVAAYALAPKTHR